MYFEKRRKIVFFTTRNFFFLFWRFSSWAWLLRECYVTATNYLNRKFLKQPQFTKTVFNEIEV